MHVWVEKDPMSPRTTVTDNSTHGYYQSSSLYYMSRKIKNCTLKCVIKSKSIEIIVPVLMTVIYQYLVQNKLEDIVQKYPSQDRRWEYIYAIFLTGAR